MGTDTDRQAASVGRGAAVEPLHVEALSPCRNTPIPAVRLSRRPGEQPRLELGGEDRQPSVAGRTEPASVLRPGATISGIGADIREVTILEPNHELEIGGWIEEGRASSIGVSCPRSAEMPPDSAPPSSSSGSRSSSSGSSRSVAQSLRLTTSLGSGGQPRPPEIDTRRPRPLQAATMTSTPSEKKLP